MLRSLYTATSGIAAQQTKLDVTANNISNVATAGYKKSSVQFSDTLSQTIAAATGPQAEVGGTNAAQIGLGVRVGEISTSFTQGSAEATGVGTDLMIEGDGFFVLGRGGENSYTRSGAFTIDGSGRLVAGDGSLVQGWTAQDGVINPNTPFGAVTIPNNATLPAQATENITLSGNVPSDAAIGATLVRDVSVFDADGVKSLTSLTFTRTADGWDVADAGGTISQLTFENGALTAGGTATTADGIDIDLTGLTGFAKLETLKVSNQDGFEAGTLSSYSIGADGAINGVFSNGEIETIAQLTLATFENNGGLTRAGNTSFAASANSGQPVYGTAGDGQIGELQTGSLEMSNVDLSSEMVNLITSQRAMQSNSRVLTTSDSVLEELVNLKR